MRLNRVKYVEIEISYPYTYQRTRGMGPSWDSDLEDAIERAIGRTGDGWSARDSWRWALSLNVKETDIPAIKYAIETCFGKAVKVRA